MNTDDKQAMTDRFDEMARMLHRMTFDALPTEDRAVQAEIARTLRATWNEAIEAAALKALQEHPLTDEDAIAIDERVAHIRALKVQQ